jgi:hypothetical protein
MAARLSHNYSRKAISDNIARLTADGLALPSALAASYAFARVCYFRKYPSGILPPYLRWQGRGMKQFFSASGAPIGVARNPVPLLTLLSHAFTARDIFKNPAEPAREIAAAQRRYKAFTGHEADNVTTMPRKTQAKVSLAFGELIEIGYISNRDGQHYRHTFKKRSRPLLTASHDGTSIDIVGGQYLFTSRGIEDR